MSTPNVIHPSRRDLRLTVADEREAQALAKEILAEGGSISRWERADRTPALSARVHNLVTAATISPTCAVTAWHQLEQFRRYGEIGQTRGGRLWLRPCRKVGPGIAFHVEALPSAQNEGS